ncbi:hypothetical protein BDP81DRAFT_105410 [Colletotrichum phormii]|uniref:Uncharacterized protein n=1 Tax=Colletotrichum phormii TaxID=359342 RepID=A0AAJ0ECE1_9PEZI|nr:uncharacterized protein BDP81DRAFT_105410 [Colletotrichum phormii]KAK1624618.1 hypothetical protein BDP81DRAFT_105410 [Colletotrichum phormii]
MDASSANPRKPHLRPNNTHVGRLRQFSAAADSLHWSHYQPMASVTGHEVTPPSITAVDCHLHSAHAEFEQHREVRPSGPRARFVRRTDHFMSSHCSTESCACSIRCKALVNVPSSPCTAALRDGGLRSSGRGSPEPEGGRELLFRWVAGVAVPIVAHNRVLRSSTTSTASLVNPGNPSFTRSWESLDCRDFYPTEMSMDPTSRPSLHQ